MKTIDVNFKTAAILSFLHRHSHCLTKKEFEKMVADVEPQARKLAESTRKRVLK